MVAIARAMRLFSWVRFILAVAAMVPVLMARPNIVLIVADDLRADLLEEGKDRAVLAPHVAELAAKGFHSTATRLQGSDQGAVCVASRAMLWSGQSLWRKSDQLTGRKTLGELLQENGYLTFGTGKWHNGDEALVRTFTEAVNITPGFLPKGHESAFGLVMVENGTLTRGKNEVGTHSTDLIGRTAVEMISRQEKERPFFLYVGFNAPHDPFDVPPAYLPDAKWKKEDIEATLPANFLSQPLFDHGAEVNSIRDEKLLPKPLDREAVARQNAKYRAMISQLDHWVGEMMAELAARGLEEDTLVVFTSDHGLARGSHGLLGKQNLYEHSLKVPMVVKGAMTAPGTNGVSPFYLGDVFATLLDCAGCAVPAGQDEGQSLLKVISGGEAPPARATYHAYGSLMRAVIVRPHKLIEYRNSSGKFTRLYDLEVDPLEMRDLSAEPARAEDVVRLRAAMRAEKVRYGDNDPLFWD